MEKKYNIDELFRQSLENHSADPPPYVWDNIDSALDKLDGKRKSRFFWLMGSFLAVTTAFVGGYYISGIMSNGNHQALQAEFQSYEITVPDNGGNFSTRPDNSGNSNSSNGSSQIANNNQSTIHNDGNEVVYGTDVNSPVNVNPKGSQNSGSTHSGSVNHNSYAQKGSHNGVTHKSSKQQTKNGGSFTTTHKSGNSRSSDNFVIEAFPKTEANEIHLDRLDAAWKEDYVKVKPRTNKKNVRTHHDFNGKTVERPRYTIAPYFAPMLTTWNASAPDPAYTPLAATNNKYVESMRFGYSSGLLLGYSFTERLTVFLGATYNQFGVTTERQNLMQAIPTEEDDFTGEIHTSAGMINGVAMSYDPSEQNPPVFTADTIAGGTVTALNQTFGFVEVPVLVRYKFFGPKVGLTLTGGLSTGFLVRNDVDAETANGRTLVGSTANLRNFNMNFQLGVGLEAKLLSWKKGDDNSGGLYFNLEPTFRYSFLNWSNDKDRTVNPIFFSATTGLSFKF